MDQFEKYIRSNREQFDDRNPDPAIWNQIEARLPQKSATHRRLTMWKTLSIAAVALVLILSGVIAGMFMGRGSLSQDPAYAEFMQAEQYYTVEYNKKKSELAQYQYDPVVDEDLKELDKMYEALAKELTETSQTDKSELINAMIQIYQTRIQLLERVLNKIEQGENEKQINIQNEKTEI